VGAGVGPRCIDHCVGIVKTYTTRVGNGPFPTELDNEIGARLRAAGKEFGSTTGRPRRCGWFDSVTVRKAIQLSGVTRLALMKLDVLNGFDEIKICTAYEIDGRKTDQFPTSAQDLERAKPVYETLPGWGFSPLDRCKTLPELPNEAQTYVQRLKSLCHDIPILLVSVGADREETIEVETI